MITQPALLGRCNVHLSTVINFITYDACRVLNQFSSVHNDRHLSDVAKKPGAKKINVIRYAKKNE